ncbi:MAG: hypothetical protein K0B11_09250 [Mariniphaga sp.]|nr:hypothetical protein [Mariniphaga sp.]
MKNLKSILTGLALVLLTGTVWATGNMKVNIVPAENETAVVQILNVAESNYEIELKNETGDLVFYKKTDAPSANYARHYDFSMLEDGNYILTVKGDNEKMENSLKIVKGTVEVLNQRKEVAPFFTVRDNRLEVSYLNFELENLKVMVYDNNTLLFEKNLEPEFAVNYGLDLSNLKSGKYDAVLTSGNNFFEYHINKK